MFTSIISYASGWGHFTGVSGKSSPGWSRDLKRNKALEEEARKNKAWNQLHNPCLH